MIPKTIHYCWVGGAPLPESVKKCIKSWRKYCPDYEIIEWNESNYDFTAVPYMREAYEAKKWGFVPDYARLDIVYTHGGIYLDTDVEIVRSFDPLLPLHGFAGFQNDNNVAFGLGFGAEAGNQIIKKLLDSYKDRHFLHPDGSQDQTPAPEINTAVLILETDLKKNGELQELGGFTVFPQEYFCPKSYKDGIIRKTNNTYSIHHFDASWFSEEEKKQLLNTWAYYNDYEKRHKKREKKLQRRKLWGGLFRQCFGNERWETIKLKVISLKKGNKK